MFGIGKMKIIPGTFGSLVTVIILYILFHIFNISSNLILFGLIIIFIFPIPNIVTNKELNVLIIFIY